MRAEQHSLYSLPMVSAAWCRARGLLRGALVREDAMFADEALLLPSSGMWHVQHTDWCSWEALGVLGRLQHHRGMQLSEVNEVFSLELC